ncbi:hypothetical protein GS8_1669 [Geobacillus stearothermophilus]|uniref:Uncharacterized protein n=1 Tax=Geobacillus stearothermophilus TaxID=1422 RepID=A0A150MS32_GEOSE|nr:hypothetical protein GS8_1669 [Geobacillus stearothermophilus]KYD27145.1 hypothetical protein B4109_0515 [Geobacillus stearothermophilus]
MRKRTCLWSAKACFTRGNPPFKQKRRIFRLNTFFIQMNI